MRARSRTLLVAAAVAGLMFSFAAPAAADSTVAVKYGPTQRQSDASLTSTQVGTYAKGAKVTLRCYVNGQSVMNNAKQWSKIWYRDGSGWFVPAVDLNAAPSEVVAGIPACGAIAPGLSTSKTYTITSLVSNKLVDVTGGAAKDGVKIQQYSGSKSNRAQQFQFTSTGGRFFKVASVLNTTKAWDVSKSDGKSVQLWGWSGQTKSNQQWLVFAPSGKTAEGVEFRLRADTNKCLDVPGGSTANVKLQVYQCNGTKSQRFRLTEVVDTSSAQILLPTDGASMLNTRKGPAPLFGHDGPPAPLLLAGGKATAPTWVVDTSANANQAVYARFKAGGKVTLKVEDVRNYCGNLGAGGVGVQISVRVDGTWVGTVLYQHLASIPKDIVKGKSVDTSALYLGKTYTGDYTDCWQGAHVHMEVLALGGGGTCWSGDVVTSKTVTAPSTIGAFGKGVRNKAQC